MARRTRGLARRAIQRTGDGLEMRRRRASADKRVLPDFLVLGAQKAGTTSLFEYLSQHEMIAVPRTKEVHFFDTHHDEGERWYRAMFPLRSEVPVNGLAGEATPYYLFHPLVPARVQQAVPTARLIVLIRDPVERAWSHYRHEVALGRASRSFAQALEAEPKLLEAAESAVMTGKVVSDHQNASFMARGRYAEQLERWFAQFPPSQLHVVVAEEMFADPARTYDGVLRFLGLPEGHRPAFEAHAARPHSGLEPHLRKHLQQHFEAPNAALARLLGRELPWP